MKKHLWRVLLVLVVMVAVLAIPVSADDSFNMQIDGYQNYDEANEILKYVNSYRAAAGVAPLKMDPELTRLAMQRSTEVAVYYSHTRPDGSSWYTVMDGTSFANYSSGENVAIGYQNAAAVSQAWYNSPGHRANMINSDYVSIGIGCFYQEDGTRCWAQLFSTRSTNGKNNQTGVKAVKNVVVNASASLVSLSVSTIDDCNMELYAGQRRKIEIIAINKEFTQKTVTLSDNFKVTSLNTNIVKAEGTSLVGVAKGTATAYVYVGNLRLSVPVEVFNAPGLSYTVNQGNTVVTWDDPNGNAILFYKEVNDEMWTYGNSNGNYTLWGIDENDVYVCVLRIWDGNNYVDISEPLYIGNLELQIKKQPSSKVVKNGATAKITVEAMGNGLKYQWQYRKSSKSSWANAKADGSNTATLSVPATVGRHGYQYRCRITDANGDRVYTNIATLHVLGIKTQPTTKTVVAGRTAKLTVAATGHKLTYQWQYRTSSKGSWANAKADGSKTATLSVPASIGRHGYQYRCKITDSKGNTIYTNAVSLYVLGIKTQPASKTVKVGATAKFTVTAVGNGLKYQWQYRTSSKDSWKNASATGSKTKTLSVPGTTSRNGYQYRCKITDSKGNVLYTDIVKLTVKK